MKWLLLILSIATLSVSAQQVNSFRFLKPFQSSYYSTEDIGVSASWGRTFQSNNYSFGAYYSAQTSPLGAGIWFHTSGFGGVSYSPDRDDLGAFVGINAGVSLLIVEARGVYHISNQTVSVVPAIGFGFNRCCTE